MLDEPYTTKARTCDAHCQLVNVRNSGLFETLILWKIVFSWVTQELRNPNGILLPGSKVTTRLLHKSEKRHLDRVNTLC